MYIAIEGVKGVGKTTVINHLPQMLRDLWSDNTSFEILSRLHKINNKVLILRHFFCSVGRICSRNAMDRLCS